VSSLTYHAAREAIAAELVRDATAHDGGRFDEIGRRYDSLEHAFPQAGSTQLLKLRIALTFWDAWIDARNRGWQRTKGVQPAEWAQLARTIAEDLAADRDISSARVLTHYGSLSLPSEGDRAGMIASRLRDRGAI
jgi:hypothetical protein